MTAGEVQSRPHETHGGVNCCGRSRSVSRDTLVCTVVYKGKVGLVASVAIIE